MPKDEIKSLLAPAPIGPYSQAVRAGSVVFLSGQIPLDPSTGAVVVGGIDVQTRQTLKNIEMILKEAGLSMKDIVKTTIFMKDLAKFNAMNTVYGEFFSRPYPARATVEVKGLPKDVEIEIDAVAVTGDVRD